MHFTFHILRRTAGGRRIGNVAEGPHSFHIKRHRRRRRRRGRCRRSVGCESPAAPTEHVVPRAKYFSPLAKADTPPPSHYTDHHQSPAHPLVVLGASRRTGSRRGGRGKQATRLHCTRYILLYTMLFGHARWHKRGI